MKKLGKKHVIIFALVTALILALAAFSMKMGNNPVSNAVGTVLSPVQSVMATAVRGTKNFVKNIVSSGENARENKKLKEEVLALNEQLRMVEGYKTENERLRKLIQLNETRRDFKSIGANVIGKSTTETSSTITIDKGSAHGVKKNAVVTVAEGLVGVVYEVGYNYAKVKTIFDAESSVSAICLRSGDMGIVEPTGFLASSGQCSMNYIDRSAKTVVGDVVETSGTGGIYPRGITVGKIKEITEDSRNLTLSAVLETDVNINYLDTVLVSVE